MFLALFMNYSQNNRGFSLIEVLIVLGLMIFLFSSFFYLWNTSQVFKKGRDSRRINDLQTLDAAIKNLLATQSDLNMGEENIIYTSLPDSSSTCGNYALNKISSPFSYRCQAVGDYLKTNGQGWLPINFASSSVLVLSSLPVDPLNNADYFYAYQVKNGRYKLTARFEDKSFIEKMVFDGGLEPTLYEVGSDLRMPSPQSGLVLYLPFSEGTGTVAYDLSGYGNNGTLYSSTTICSNPPTSGCPQWVNGKVGKALSFDGVDDYVSFAYGPNNIQSFTIIAWVNSREYQSGWNSILGLEYGNTNLNSYWFGVYGNKFRFYTYHGSDDYLDDNNSLPTYQWAFLAGVYENFKKYIYRDSDLVNSKSVSGAVSYSSPYKFAVGSDFNFGNPSYDFIKAYIDEVRIYNRALSPDEIKAIYEATK